MKILITGGHLSPALTVIDKLRQKFPEIEIVFVGRKYPLEGERTFSLEYKEIFRRKIKFVNLNTGRLTRTFSPRLWASFLKIPFGFFSSFFIILKERPSLILSFGGYLALPVAIWGFVFGVPIFTHEQTAKPGLANRVIGYLAKKIFISFQEARNSFPKEKVILSGNPIRESIFFPKKKPFEIKYQSFPLVYVTGGSLGSHSINLHIEKILSDLLRTTVVVHQTGETTTFKDFERLTRIRDHLPKELQKRYFVFKHFFEDELGYVYSLADLVVSRAGANTFFELIALKKPAILVPLPWSAGQEQLIHAKIFAQAGCGEIFFQDESSDKLLVLIEKMIANIQHYERNFKNLSSLCRPNATEKIIDEVLSSIKPAS